ncbi:MAG: hypothetical protein V1893_00170 [Candidatus Omnitrophota bacterium]
MVIYEDILREFQKHKVRYALVGGIAFNLLGGNRNTLDLDILAEMTGPNLRKIVSILKKSGYHVKQPVDPIDIADKKIRKNWIENKNMKALNFYKGDETYEEVDLIIGSSVDYEEVRKDAMNISVGSLKLSVISPKKLIKMKQEAGRDVDLLDVKALKILMRRK